jgi:hypothetical protein
MKEDQARTAALRAFGGITFGCRRDCSDHTGSTRSSHRPDARAKNEVEADDEWIRILLRTAFSAERNLIPISIYANRQRTQ